MRTRIVSVVVLVVIALVGIGYRQGWHTRLAVPIQPADAASPADPHAGHDHGPGTDALILSDQARKNLGLEVGPVRFSDYWRTVTIPAVVTEQPGHSERRISSSLQGIITRVYIRPGQTVYPGDPLFDLQPMGEVLLSAQSNLLKTLQELDVVEREIQRLQPLADQGTIPTTRLLEKQYEKQRLDGLRQVQTQELLVRGLTRDQVEQIVASKVLVRQLTIFVPGIVHVEPSAESAPARPKSAPAPAEGVKEDTLYSVEAIGVFPGKLVQPGDELCDLAHHTELYLAGLAFQRDAELVGQVIEHQRPVRAEFEATAAQPLVREGLHVRYADNVIDPTSGTFRFFLPITNEVARDIPGPGDVTYRSWRFKPGQRARLEIPVELWTGRIVLPSEAVVQEGAEAYVFREAGGEFDRVPVTVIHANSRAVVLANDGQLFIGDRIAMNQAYQLNLALKKQQGGGGAGHHGHEH
uniref:Secretion protein HlyD n=1 Tax=Schlesneria paludicola TaxID=360056 RepID=A0A7C2K2K6_9PLAN